MSRYRDNPSALNALVRADQVHADLYTDPEIFAMEQERLFANTWQFAGHASQVPSAGDYQTLEIAGQPLVMVRQSDGSISVLVNRCAHKGAPVVTEKCGNAGKMLRCPYHAWSYRLDGSLISIPLRAEYEGTAFSECPGAKGLGRVAMAEFHGFIFVRLAEQGESFESFTGPMLDVLRNLIDRSPLGQVSLAGGCVRSTVHCNWKMYLENVNDAVHAVATHASVVDTANQLWSGQDQHEAKPVAVEQVLPFGTPLESVRAMGAKVFPAGHSILGTRASLHSGYLSMHGYEKALVERHGDEKARKILSFAPQNAIIFPSLALKCSPQVLRVVRPVAVDRTIIEAWALRLEGAPTELLDRTLHYNRLVYSPMSPVAHDDVHVFEGMQRALHARRNPWISLHRMHRNDEALGTAQEHSATSEILMRNQFQAWARWMTQPEQEPVPA